MLYSKQAIVTLIMLVLMAMLTACGRSGSVEPLDVGSDTEPGTKTADLEGTEWVLTSLNGGGLVEGSNITLNFAEGRLNGFAGCNAYGGKYAVTDEGSLTITEIERTLQLCRTPEGVMEQEEVYINTLTNAAVYRVMDHRLEIESAAGETILVFAIKEQFPMHPSALVGTKFMLISLNGSRPIEGSTITLAFDSENQISGHAGCRDYVGAYEASGNDIRFTYFEMRGTPCLDEEALLKQEGEYTTTLGWATDYRLSEGQLEIFTARGEVLIYVPLPPTEAPARAPTITPTLTPTTLPIQAPTPTPGRLLVPPPPGLVYRTSDGLWRVGGDGQPQQLLPDPGAQLSPDGQRALHTNGQGIWVLDLVSGEERNLLAAGGYPHWCCPRWAGDAMILFGSWPEGTDPGPSTGYLTAAAADGSWVQVLDPTSISYGLPAVSPDGQTIAYDRSGTAWLYRWDSGPEPLDVAAYGLPQPKSIRIGSPAWSPDGRQLAWVVGGSFGDGWRIGIAVFDLDARTSRLLHPYEPLGVGGWPGAPVWSPDGQWLVYRLGHATDPAQSGLWVLRADGVDERLLGQGGNPVWSPDGRWLVFTQHIADQGTAVWLLETSIWEPRLMDLPAGAVSVGWVSTFAHPAPPVLPEPTSIRYSNPTLGFAVDHPDDWEVTGPTNQVDPLIQSWSVIEFASNLYGYGAQAFGKYAVTVAVGESMGRTLTETVEYSFSPIVPQFREGIKTHCCLTIGGEPAMEVFGFPLSRWGSRQIVVIHDGREYRLTFYPQRTLDGVTSSDAAARAAFDAFLKSFAFIPITATPIPPTPTITPAPTPASTSVLTDDAEGDIVESLLPFRYARVWSTQVPVYPAPGDPVQMMPVGYLLPPRTWVSIKDEVQVDGRVWYRIEKEEYVLASDVLLASPSTFRGVTVGGTYRPLLGFVIADLLNVRARPGIAWDNPPLATLSRYTAVNILGRETVNDGVWYQIGPGQYVYSAYVRVVTATPRPVGVAWGEKWIAVNLSEQTLAAYEGDRMVFATLISTGLPWWQTPQGVFRIWVKISAGKMSGGSLERGDDYYLQDVPWTMYFYGSYGLHGTYWHDGFGAPRSRGCVNLSPRDAKWLFDWTSPTLPQGQRAVLSSRDNPGTWVYVYSTAVESALANALPGTSGSQVKELPRPGLGTAVGTVTPFGFQNALAGGAGQRGWMLDGYSLAQHVQPSQQQQERGHDDQEHHAGEEPDLEVRHSTIPPHE